MARNNFSASRILIGAVVFAVLTGAVAQDVRSLRESSYDLPQTDLDREVLTLFFGAIDAVQGKCSTGLEQSLAAEQALAACATFSSFSLDLSRQMAQLAFEGNYGGTPHAWLTPWQAADGFGSVRRVVLDSQEYILAIDEGLAYVIRFLE